jgi:hypothetical protein
MGLRVQGMGLRGLGLRIEGGTKLASRRTSSGSTAAARRGVAMDT